jgi:hypothetical protein
MRIASETFMHSPECQILIKIDYLDNNHRPDPNAQPCLFQSIYLNTSGAGYN